jgi:outer membrane protein assembly factor BamB
MALLVAGMVPWAVTSEDLASENTFKVDVLFHFTPEDYSWGAAFVNGTASAVTVSRNAANLLNRGFVYDKNSTGSYIEIGGLAPPPDSWNWTLLKWGRDTGWQEWIGDPGVLQIKSNEAIGWCPSDMLFPAPDPLSKYPWPMFRSQASRRGESLSPPVLSNLTYWTAKLDAPILSSPCVADGKLFVSAGGEDGGLAKMVCLRETDGSMVWEKEMGAAGPQYSSPAYAHGMVIFGTGNGKVRALRAENGDQLWEYTANPTENMTSSPVIACGRVIVSGGLGAIHCLDLSGNLIWRAETGAPMGLSSPAVLAGGTMSDRLVAATMNGKVFCLNLSDGGQLWNLILGAEMHRDYILATPPISQGGYAFVSLIRNEPPGNPSYLSLFSIYLKDGIQQWTALYNLSESSPALAAGGLFLGTDTEFLGHHPDRGTRSWGIPLAPVDSSPAVAGGYVYFSTNLSNGTVACARVGGGLEWTRDLNTSFFSSPVVADGRLFACGMDGQIFCLGRPPQPRVSAKLSAASEATVGSRMEVKVLFNNSGEAAAAFTAYLTVDGNRTSLKNGPARIPAGESRTAVFEWTAQKGTHTLGVSLDGADAAVNGTLVNVKPASQSCVIAYAILPVLGGALLLPLIVRMGWNERRGGPR